MSISNRVSDVFSRHTTHLAMTTTILQFDCLSINLIRFTAKGERDSEKTDEVLQRQLIPLTQDGIDWNSIVIAVRHLRIQH